RPLIPKNLLRRQPLIDPRQSLRQVFDVIDDRKLHVPIHSPDIAISLPIDRDTKRMHSPLTRLSQRRLGVFQRILVSIAVIERTPIADEDKQPRPRLLRQQFGGSMANGRPITVLLHGSQSAQTLRCLPVQPIVKILDHKKIHLASALARITIERISVSDRLERFTGAPAPLSPDRSRG